jgi:hypothetical protein
MTHSDFDGSLDSSLCYDLRGRRVPREETNPDRRCKIVVGWPAKATKSTEPTEPAKLKEEHDSPTMYSDHELIVRGERLYPALESQHIGAEGGPPTYRHDRTSTPTFDAHIQAEASRIERELRERADRWRDDEEVSDTDVSDEGGATHKLHRPGELKRPRRNYGRARSS